jgi:ABC-type uncharacterized transport system ATPase component
LAKRLFLIIIPIIILILVYILISENNYVNKRDLVEEWDEDHGEAIQVIVHNGSGFRGVANYVRQSLVGGKIEVVGIGNTRRFIYDESIIVVKHNNDLDLRRLKRMTGIENVIYAVNENYHVPFIIIAGRDYQVYFR